MGQYNDDDDDDDNDDDEYDNGNDDKEYGLLSSRPSDVGSRPTDANQGLIISWHEAGAGTC